MLLRVEWKSYSKRQTFFLNGFEEQLKTIIQKLFVVQDKEEKSNIKLNTYPTNFFKERAVASQVDELLVKEPGELEVQGGVMWHLAGKHDALTQSNVQVSCWTGDCGGLWTQGVSKKGEVRQGVLGLFLFFLLLWML